MNDLIPTLADTQEVVDILQIISHVLAAILGWFAKKGKDRIVHRNGR
jgi:hypothetical protein